MNSEMVNVVILIFAFSLVAPIAVSGALYYLALDSFSILGVILLQSQCYQCQNYKKHHLCFNNF